MTFCLTFLNRFDIKDEDAGLKEPSGLTLGRDGDGLWTVSDDTARVFRLSLEGELDQDRSFDVPETGLEGITIDPSGKYLFTVREESNEIFKLDIAGQDVADRRLLKDMDGYDPISHFFENDPENKGLEGITWNSHSDTLFVLKEGHPGLLIEIAANLGAVLCHVNLDVRNGFVDDGRPGHEVDYSGICYDPSRAAFWIVSDKAERIYLYDRSANRVVQSAALGYGANGEYEPVEKAEGVAYDPDRNRLYVVSDKEVALYVYDVRF